MVKFLIIKKEKILDILSKNYKFWRGRGENKRFIYYIYKPKETLEDLYKNRILIETYLLQYLSSIFSVELSPIDKSLSCFAIKFRSTIGNAKDPYIELFITLKIKLPWMNYS